MKGFDFDHPFFKPLWVRIVVFGICFGWGLFEFTTGNALWGVLFCAMGLWAGHSFFIANLHRGDDDE